MTAVPPTRMARNGQRRVRFQPLKGNDGRAARQLDIIRKGGEFGFNPSKEMTAVPPNELDRMFLLYVVFQPLKGNDGRAAAYKWLWFNIVDAVSTPQRK